MVLTHEQLANVAEQVFRQLFGSADSVDIDGTPYRIERTGRAQLLTVNFDEYRFMEQNPMKTSKWAAMAKQGHKIIWIFKGWNYIGRIVDGEVTLFN